jgi:Na+/H+ antiporter NhaD/arsenite permease-like protein
MILITIFIVGYVLIIAENSLKLNKAASAIVTGVLCWVAYTHTQPDIEVVNAGLEKHLADIAAILFFLLGAMTIVELIDAHDGFDVITNRITTRKKQTLLWLLSGIAFFLSAILDNLTTTIVMISLLRKIMPKNDDRILFTCMIVIAANAGGAWSPIGDVTTTMLWIGGQISTLPLIKSIFIPSLLNILVPLILLHFRVKGNVLPLEKDESSFSEGHIQSTPFQRNVIFMVGLAALLFVPIFKAITHLPPYMGVFLGLGVLWIVSEIIHSEKDELEREPLSVISALRKIDTPSVLFFWGILMSVAALESSGTLKSLSLYLSQHIDNQYIIVTCIGLLSAIIDNVPLVAATTGMYDLQQIASDQPFWLFLAYCAGTGGSILIIGSAAGVAAMGMESISFMTYFKKISWLAFLGYIAGALYFVLFVGS